MLLLSEICALNGTRIKRRQVPSSLVATLEMWLVYRMRECVGAKLKGFLNFFSA